MTQHQAQPVEAAGEPQKNTIGLVGFIVSLASILTCGFVAPIGALVSFIGVFKRPRGLAVAGLIIGLILSVVPLLFGGAVLAFIFGWGAVKQATVMQNSKRGVQVFYDANGRLPSETEYDDIVDQTIVELSQTFDAQGLRFEYEYQVIDDMTYHVAFPGFDKTLGTSDDLTEDVQVFDSGQGGGP